MVKKRKRQIKETEETDVFVKISPEDALESKKDLLQITASLINLEMLNSTIKDQGRKEVRYRNLAKRELKSVNALLGRVIEDMPKIERIPKMGIKEIELESGTQKIKVSPKEKSQNNTLNQELLEIQRKLARLG